MCREDQPCNIAEILTQMLLDLMKLIHGLIDRPLEIIHGVASIRMLVLFENRFRQ
jgi:hypothetical protein